MRRFALLAAFGCVAAVCVACQPGTVGLTEQDKAAIRSVDEPVRQTMLSEKPDWAATVAMLYAPDVELLPPDGPILKGLDAAKAFYSAWSPVKDFKVTEDRLEGTGRFAFRRASYAVTVVVPGAPEPVTMRGKDIVVLRKEADGKWKCIAEIWNSDTPTSDLTVPTGPVAEDASAELKKLGDIVGRWQMDGTFQSDPKTPGGPVAMTLACNWFTGGRQVFCRFSGTLAGTPFEEVFPYSYDAKTRAYEYYSVVSDGSTTHGKLAIQPGTWVHSADTLVGGKPARSRFTYSNMSPAGGAWKYELSVVGGPWTVIGEGKYVKTN